MILKDSDDETDIEILNDEGFFFIDNDGEGDPLYIIDGEEAKAEDVKKLSPGKIKSIDVSKGKSAKKKYGRKAKHGVVEITTKKKGWQKSTLLPTYNQLRQSTPKSETLFGVFFLLEENESG